jgi:acetyl esterase/lipase
MSNPQMKAIEALEAAEKPKIQYEKLSKESTALVKPLIQHQTDHPHGEEGGPDMAKVLPVIITSKADATNGGFLHVPPQWREYCKNIMNTKTAVIMLASERGSLLGPSDIYPALADDLASNHNIPALRLDHKYAGTRSVPANLLGVDGAIKYLQKNLKVHQIILVGWEWGGKLALGAAASISHTSKCYGGR